MAGWQDSSLGDQGEAGPGVQQEEGLGGAEWRELVGGVSCWGPSHASVLEPSLSSHLSRTPAFLPSAQGIMLVYDITNEKSFDNIRNWIRNIEEVRLAPLTCIGASYVSPP